MIQSWAATQILAKAKLVFKNIYKRGFILHLLSVGALIPSPPPPFLPSWRNAILVQCKCHICFLNTARIELFLRVLWNKWNRKAAIFFLFLWVVFFFFKWMSLLLSEGVRQLSIQIKYHFNHKRLRFSSLSFYLKGGQIVYHTQLLWLCAFLMVIAGSWKQSAVPNTHCMLNCAEL